MKQRSNQQVGGRGRKKFPERARKGKKTKKEKRRVQRTAGQNKMKKYLNNRDIGRRRARDRKSVRKSHDGKLP